MIPKVIHYCWFGRKQLPTLALKCIESWRKYMPDYEIREWNEDNFDVNQIPYTKEAYENKKYAFVSDYARFWILYNYGGIYFDTDVEVIKNMDHILNNGAFMGCEKNIDNKSLVNPGLGIATEPKHPFYKKILESYQNCKFVKNNKFNLETVVIRTTNLLKKEGLSNTEEIQHICNLTIYPSRFFCPIDYDTKTFNISSDTVSIHHYASSWVNKYDNLPLYAKIWTFLHLPNTNIKAKILKLLYK